MRRNNKSVKGRLERRKLLGAMGVSPMATNSFSVGDNRENSKVDRKEIINSIHFVRAGLTHVTDIPGTLLGDRDIWSRYIISEPGIQLTELLTRRQRDRFTKESEIIHPLGSRITVPPTTVPQNPLRSLPVEPRESNPIRSVCLAEPYEPPQVELRTDSDESVVVEKEAKEDILLDEESSQVIEFKERNVYIDTKNGKEEFSVTPLIRVVNYGEIPVFGGGGDAESTTGMDEPFTIGENQRVKKMEE